MLGKSQASDKHYLKIHATVSGIWLTTNSNQAIGWSWPDQLETIGTETKKPAKCGLSWRGPTAWDAASDLLNGAGDRRTVVGREGPIFRGLEFGGFFDVPHRVSIKKSANYGFHWNRIGGCGDRGPRDKLESITIAAKIQTPTSQSLKKHKALKPKALIYQALWRTTWKLTTFWTENSRHHETHRHSNLASKIKKIGCNHKKNANNPYQ